MGYSYGNLEDSAAERDAGRRSLAHEAQRKTRAWTGTIPAMFQTRIWLHSVFLKPSEAEFKDNGLACLAEEILR